MSDQIKVLTANAAAHARATAVTVAVTVAVTAAVTMMMTATASLVFSPAQADQPLTQTTPSDPTPPAENPPTQHREQRIGGRLERVTITRENGLTETYQNNRPDTIWSAQENELGETPNMRQWIIRTW